MLYFLRQNFSGKYPTPKLLKAPPTNVTTAALITVIPHVPSALQLTGFPCPYLCLTCGSPYRAQPLGVGVMKILGSLAWLSQI